MLFPKQLMASPRTSMESWGSSSGAPEEDSICEWKSEQISLLSRVRSLSSVFSLSNAMKQTLDALPGHLYTPFNGPVPPSNLLDKIARSVSNAQGVDWPHSIRQTRAKLVEIARGRNKENVHMTIDEADELLEGDHLTRPDDTDDTPPAKLDPTGKPRPLYRQSSMDFLPSKGKDTSNLTRYVSLCPLAPCSKSGKT